MDAEALRQAVENAGLAAAGAAFLAGLLFSFNPVALASIPVSLAYVTRGRDRSQALLFGAMFILGIFGLLIFSIMRIGLHADNNFYRFICLGAAIMFLVQFAINVGSTLGLLPVIGITFPFFSYGGSSLLINAMLIGIVQSASVYRSLS